MTTKTNTVLDKALAYKKAGFEVLPNHPQAKYPQGIDAWQTKDFTEAELKQHIAKKGWGVGLRNLEGLDFDNKGNPGAQWLFDRWCEAVQQLAPGLVDRLTVETTPSGGYHILFKCETIGGNQQLACRPPTPDEKRQAPKLTKVALIETRGKGGQFMVSPSPGYKLIQGDILAMPELTPAERKILLDCARTFDQSPKREINFNNGADNRPGDYYNAEAGTEALGLLKAAGWTEVYKRSDGVIYLRRPGKDSGVSATYGAVGPDIFYNFSSNGAPFEAEAGYSPFAVFTVLQHGSDYKAAAREVAARFGMNGEGESIPDIDTTGPVFERLSATQLMERPPKIWLIDKLIGQQDLIMVFGDAGSGKTFVALDIIAAGALGQAVAAQFESARPLRVAYCAGEGLAGLPGRVAALMYKYQLKPQRFTVDFFTDVPQFFEQDSEKNIYTFVSQLSEQSEQYDLIVIDTLHAASVGADENHAKDAGVILQAMKYTRQMLGCSVLLVHHANKAGGYRGSSALHGAMDTMLQTKADKNGYGMLECFKQKDAERFDTLYFRIKGEHVSQSAYVEWVEKSTLDLNEPSKVDYAEQKIIDLLTDKPGLNQSQIHEALADEIGRHSIRAALKQMSDAGIVQTEQRGRAICYQLSLF